MRFQKRIKIAPGVKLNLSKSGVSTTVGARGASVNIGKNGAHVNTGIPGTGISHRQKIGAAAKKEIAPKPEASAKSITFGLLIWAVIIGIVAWIFV